MTNEGEAKDGKDEKDPFAYSWYLPTGAKARAGEHPLEPSSEQEPEPENEAMVESGQRVSEPEPRQVAAGSRSGGGSGFHLKASASQLRIVGLSVWSVVSGVGMIALLVTQNPIPLTPVMTLGGLWAAVSAIIWFLPSKLSK
jgi:hypothetical protein